ncbi:MAG: RNA:NAD 2'-phosphotransferase, partial [uncultured Solirubrobacteraceae bacterium]
ATPARSSLARRRDGAGRRSPSRPAHRPARRRRHAAPLRTPVLRGRQRRLADGSRRANLSQPRRL